MSVMYFVTKHGMTGDIKLTCLYFVTKDGNFYKYFKVLSNFLREDGETGKVKVGRNTPCN